MLNTPIFRSTLQTVSGVHTHPTRPMSYSTANDALKGLGELAGYRYPIHCYCFRRWVANEANRKLPYIRRRQPGTGNVSLDVNHSPAMRRLYIGRREQVAIFGVDRGTFSFN